LGSHDLGYFKIKLDKKLLEQDVKDAWYRLESDKDKGSKSEVRIRLKLARSDSLPKKKRSNRKSSLKSNSSLGPMIPSKHTTSEKRDIFSFINDKDYDGKFTTLH
jgi:hypothetical protein